MAASISYIVNTLIGRVVPGGSRSRGLAVLLAPLLEEAAKTLIATAMGAPVLMAHAVFGLIESIYDLSGSSGRGFMAAVFSLGSHTVFGFLAWWVIVVTREAWMGVLVVYPLHALWNLGILSLLGLPSRR